MRILKSLHLIPLIAFTLFVMSMPPLAQAEDIEVRDFSEIQKELEPLLNHPEIRKLLNTPEVQKVLRDYQAQANQIKANAKKEVENKVEAKKLEAEALVQERWAATVGKLIDDYQKSDIPRKLEQGDWSAIEETKALLRALDVPVDEMTAPATTSGTLNFDK